MTNSQRFIDAYNKTDAALHSRFGFKPTMAYTDAVRRAAAINAVVRRFEDELVDFGRLRNAIVHKSDPEKAIAEPHDDVTEKFEHIAELLNKPPLASSIAHEPCCVKPNARLWDAINTMHDRKYSVMPVVDGNGISGVLTAKNIVQFVADNADGLQEALEKAAVTDALSDSGAYYSVIADCEVDSVLEAFEKNRKLRMLILTESGKPDGKIIGIITVGDLVAITKMLEL